jgi:hypothetical protein
MINLNWERRQAMFTVKQINACADSLVNKSFDLEDGLVLYEECPIQI